MRAHLVARGIDEAVADATVEELGDQGTLDDQRFARLFVQDKRTLEQWGADRIRRGLEARGLERELIDAALASSAGESAAGPGETELDRAVALLAARLARPPQNRRDRDRALGVLLRKGYEPELALDALARFSRADREELAR